MLNCFPYSTLRARIVFETTGWGPGNMDILYHVYIGACQQVLNRFGLGFYAHNSIGNLRICGHTIPFMRRRFLGTGSGGFLIILTVDPGHRLRLPAETADFLPWLKESSRKVILTPGPFGGVQLVRGSVPGESDLEPILSALRQSPPKTVEAGAEWMRTVRYQFTQCEAEFSDSRFGIVLPREFRDMGLLPNQGEPAAVMIFGEIIEIWSAVAWVSHVQDVRRNLQVVTERALEEFESR